MYKEKKLFGLLALLLMSCGSMTAQSKLAPMVSAYVQQAKTKRAASAEEQKPGLFMVNVQADANPDAVSTQIAERGAEVKAAMGRMLMVAATAEQLTDIAQRATATGLQRRGRHHWSH